MKDLRRILDRLTRDFDARHRSPDPVEVVHEFDDPGDREIAALVASALAYGNVRQIVAGVRRALAPLGRSPRRAAMELTPRRSLQRFEGFRHRFTSDIDMARLVLLLGHTLRRAGSLEAAFLQNYHPDHDPHIGPALDAWAAQMLTPEFPELDRVERHRDAVSRVGYLLARPSGGSACKRQCLFLRWMTRPADGVDFGLWAQVSPAHLVVPLDTHIARIARWLGLSARKTPDWKMALEVTQALRKFAPTDPVRYDFALSRLGILRQCRREPDTQRCQACLLYGVCLRAKNEA